ncbi:hypothetical protein LOZ51_002990 [Ophidiomyces ophidiicola]|nr:hypothetical protein LOZ54_003814 [Ophidiomyces ophidiicola]KAI1996828.1 hypothetical protein LOZ51_002990 [Ophidiomyces ophidiicola]
MKSPILRYRHLHLWRHLSTGRNDATAPGFTNIGPEQLQSSPDLSISTQERRRTPLTNAAIGNPFPGTYCFYRDTRPPQQLQLEYSDRFFASSKHSPIHLWASNLFRTIPISSLPEVVFIGRSNVGKSSLINALVGQDICASSSKPGRTKIMTSIGIGGTKGGDSKIALVDTPGYGKGSHAEWGQEIQKYLEKRKQCVCFVLLKTCSVLMLVGRLRRIFLLIDATVGLKPRDHDVLSFLRRFTIPYQLVLTKLDHAFFRDTRKFKPKSQNSQSDLTLYAQNSQVIFASAQPINPKIDGPGPLGDMIACSVQAKNNKYKTPSTGLSALRWAILLATGLEQIPPTFK